ncbi:hypothetical protein OG205_04280 [Lentzea sp. NBC_00516]|uniref:hypothetical protein n=1 Tax=Lentzea sp. NBC_00516 TaxID=2903582 RepID=UPI002E7FEEAF|nr:hypothetical protein [Lentzea sp. NBC_00516]WUD26235.1 hypothetical protein OG205_04280 [Lentzea sp. NBC_00516]
MDAGHPRYGVFLDPRAPSDGRAVLDVGDADVPAAEVARALIALYRTEPGLDQVMLTVGRGRSAPARARGSRGCPASRCTGWARATAPASPVSPLGSSSSPDR